MSLDRYRRRSAKPDSEPRGERDNTTIDERAEEALRSLVRILAIEAARELFEQSCATADNPASSEGPT